MRVFRVVAAVLLVCAVATAQPPKAGTVSTNSIGMNLAYIPKGTITLRTDPEDFVELEAVKAVEVEIKKSFLMGTTEVTQEQFQKIMGRNPSAFCPDGDNSHRVRGTDTRAFPVENVTWAEAKEFCAKLSDLPEEKKAGRRYMLPNSDQWEYAARSGSSDEVLYGLGETLTSAQANFNGQRPHGAAAKGVYLTRTARAGSYKANAWGLHDMHGNVWEWCEDDYAGYDGKIDRTRKTLRGGSWINRGRDCAASTRMGIQPDLRYNNIGFRVICVVEK